MKTTAIDLTILFFVVLLCCFPVVLHGLPDWGNDGLEHAVWAKAFYTQLWAGEWYPRWLTDVNAGYGCPVYFIYTPLPVFASAIFWPLLSAHDPQAWYTLGLSALLSYFCATFAFYFWCRDLAGRQAGLFAGLISIVIPYHMAVNLYTRSAIGELWAIVWLPLILFAVQRLRAHSRFAMYGLAISYAGLIASHLPTTLCFSIIPPAAALFLSESRDRFRVFLKTGIGMALGVGLASVYLIPAMLQRHEIQEGILITGWYDYRRWWLTQIQPLMDSRTRILLMTIATVAFILPVFLLAIRRGEDKKRRDAWFYFGVSVFAVGMATQASAPLWQAFPILQSLPFPTRFLQILLCTTPALAALAFPYLKERSNWRLLAGLMVSAWLVADVWGASKAYSVWRPFPSENAALYGKIRKYQQSIPNFWPKWPPADRIANFPEFSEFVEQHPPKVAVIVSPGGITQSTPVQTSGPRQLRVDIDTATPARMTVSHFYYPGWRAHIGESAITVTPSTPDGFLQLDVPAGRYLLQLELSKTASELWGERVSLATMVGMLLAAAWLLLKTKQAQSVV